MTERAIPDIETQLDSLRNRVFQFILGVAATILAVIAIRTFFLESSIPWADTALFGMTGCIYLIFRVRPAWASWLSWVFLILLYLNLADGLFPWSAEAVAPPLLFLPLLVLYGAVLGNLRMSLASALLAIGIFALIAVHYHPLSHLALIQLTNLVMLTLGTALVSYAVWRFHRVMIRELRAKKTLIQQQLEENHQLQAILFHDIANPLTALQATVEAMQVRSCTSVDLSRMDSMIQRITKIISSVRLLTRSASSKVPLEPVLVVWVVQNLQDLFQERLRSKELNLETDIPDDLVATTHEDILVHSVLSNLLSNAIKFSARGSRLCIHGRRVGERVQVRVFNPGSTIPDGVLECLNEGKGCASSTGTEGETGLGLGLQIARATMKELCGRLSAWSTSEGTCLEVDLPGLYEPNQPLGEC